MGHYFLPFFPLTFGSGASPRIASKVMFGLNDEAGRCACWGGGASIASKPRLTELLTLLRLLCSLDMDGVTGLNVGDN